MAGACPAGHDPDLCPHGPREHEKGDGGDQSARRYRIGRPSRVLTRRSVKLVNVALIPASLLPYKEHWQHIANELPKGSILGYSPKVGTRGRVVVEKVVSD